MSTEIDLLAKNVIWERENKKQRFSKVKLCIVNKSRTQTDKNDLQEDVIFLHFYVQQNWLSEACKFKKGLIQELKPRQVSLLLQITLFNVNKYMKDHIFELRRKIWIYSWSSKLYTQLDQL